MKLNYKECIEEINLILEKINLFSTKVMDANQKAIMTDISEHSMYLKVLLENSFIDIRKENQNSDNTTVGGTKPNVLIIDDDEILQKVMKTKLDKMGLNISSHTNPVDAIDYISQTDINIDIIILDILMPEMSGFEFLERARKDKNLDNIKIIVGSGRQFIKDRLRALELGADDFIEKPYEIDEIFLRIKTILKR